MPCLEKNTNFKKQANVGFGKNLTKRTGNHLLKEQQ